MRRTALVAFAAQVLAAQSWHIQYSPTDPGEALRLVDLAFASFEQGIAIGTATSAADPLRRPQPIALITSNGGKQWDRFSLDDLPVSAFFLDARTGWLVTENGLWRSADAGRTWTQVSKHAAQSMERVWFLDDQRGFAVGPNKRVGVTSDGGVTWAAVEEAGKPSGNPDYTHYTHVAFADGRRGLIVGAALPPASRPQTDGAAAGPVIRRQGPTLTLQLQTLNGGVTWSSSTAPLFGHVSDIHLAPNEGLVLFDYASQPGDRIMEWPSEVYRINLRTGASSSTYRDKDRHVTSVLLFDGSKGFLGAVEPESGQTHILSSDGLTAWGEMEIAGRVSGVQVVLAGPDPDHVWAATDTGTILHLQR